MGSSLSLYGPSLIVIFSALYLSETDIFCLDQTKISHGFMAICAFMLDVTDACGTTFPVTANLWYGLGVLQQIMLLNLLCMFVFQ